ncbi:MAG: hypothetical protein U0W40_18010 [Acidimicrobiia bacterium]
MSELRHDRLAGRAVIVAAGRAARPHQFTAAPDEERGGECPSLPRQRGRACAQACSRERQRRRARLAWRVFPGKFPIVGGPDAGSGATGAHEVVALSPTTPPFAALSDEGAAEVFCVLRGAARAPRCQPRSPRS